MTDASNPQPQFAQPQPKTGTSTGKKVALGCGLLFLLSLLGGCGLVVAGLVVSSSNDDEETSASKGETATSTGVPVLYPERPDKQPGDKDRAVGQSVELSGYTATLKSATFAQSASDFEKDGYLITEVTIANRDAKAQHYSASDWKLITPIGTVIDPTFTSVDGRLGSADLVTGGTVSGQVPFEVGSTKGDYYVIYDPDLGTSNRGIWKVTL